MKIKQIKCQMLVKTLDQFVNTTKKHFHKGKVKQKVLTKFRKLRDFFYDELMWSMILNIICFFRNTGK